MEGIEVSATMHDTATGVVLAEAGHLREPACPDSYTESAYSGTPGRTSIQPEDIEAILVQLA